MAQILTMGYVGDRERAERAEQQLSTEASTRREAIPRLKALGLSSEQIAGALGLSIGEANKIK